MKALAKVPTGKVRPRRRGIVLDAVSGAMTSIVTMLASISAPYETAAAESQIPNMGNPGPINLARYHARNRAIARHFYRTDGTFRKAFDTLAQSVVGVGPTPRTKFRELIPLWRQWSKEADTTGRLPFGLQLYDLYQDSELVGDAFCRIRARRASDGLVVPMQLQLLESEYLPFSETKLAANGNRIITGIEIDALDRRQRYWFYRTHPNDYAFGNDSTLLTGVPAAEVLHVGRPARMGGLRGEGRGVAAMVAIWMQHGFVGDAMKRQRMISRLSAFIRDSEGREVHLADEEDDPDAAAENHIKVLQYEAGELIQLPEGTNVEFPNVADVAGNASTYLRFLGLVISAAIGVPYELVTGDWAGVSDRTAVFSSTYFDTFVNQERARLEHQFCDPVWRRFVDHCIANGLWIPPADTPDHRLYDVTWSWPSRSYRHPVQEIEAKVKAMKAGLIDRYTLIEELGYDPEEVDLRMAMAMTRARLYGLKYEAHDDSGDETDASLRLRDVELERIEKIIAEIETAETDEGVLGE